MADPVEPHLNKTLYLPFDELMKNLQDKGTDDKSGNGTLVFPKLKKISAKIYKLLSTDPNVDLPKNSSRGAATILKGLLHKRKLVDKTSLHPELSRHALPHQTQVYMLHNDKETGGIDIFYKFLFDFLGSQANKKEENRNGGDAIRVMAIMLDPKHRTSLQSFLKGTKTTRAECDQSVKTDIAWAHQCLVDYKDPNYVVPRPPDLLDEDLVGGIDPNDMERMDMNRSAAWILATWRDYVKKKYRAALNKWDTETGGGSHDAHEFGMFCHGNTRWLTWVYMMDIPTNHILWCSAKGTPPPSVGRESGFENSLIKSPPAAAASSAIKRKADAVLELLTETKKGSTALSAVVKRLTGVLDGRERQRQEQITNNNPKPRSETLLEELCKNQQQHTLIISMAAATFMTTEDVAAVEMAHKKQQQRILKELRELQDN